MSARRSTSLQLNLKAAEDYLETPLYRSDFLIEHKVATSLMRLDGDSMKDAGRNAGKADVRAFGCALPL